MFGLIVRITIIFLIASVILGLIQYKKSTKTIKYMIVYLLGILLIELSAKTISSFGYPNIPLLHLYTLFEFILISLFYYHTFEFRQLRKKHFYIFIIIVSGLIVANSVFIQSIYEFNTNAKIVVSMIICFYSIIFFQQKLLSAPNKQLSLINSGILLYFSGSLLVFAFGGIVESFSENSIYLIWGINAVLSSLYYIIISYALCLNLIRKTK